MTPWQRFLPRRRIGTRLVVAVTAAMTVVLVLAGAFVYWRVAFALDRQLDDDLDALGQVARQDVVAGMAPSSRAPGQRVQVYDVRGTLLEPSQVGTPRLVGRSDIRRAADGDEVHRDVGHLLPPSTHPYRLVAVAVDGSAGRVVVVAAVSRSAHDEALRELLFQLVLTDLMAIVAAGLVGYAVTRAALGPVERYRRSAESAGGMPGGRLPVEPGRDDEIARLGRTFNGLLDTIEEGHVRERGYLADASHELRSPLAVLAAEIEWVQHRPRTEAELSRSMSSLGAQVGRLVSLSDALLDLEELLTSDQPARRSAVRVHELLTDVLAEHRTQADTEGRSLRLSAPAVLVEVDVRWLSLAVSNLVGNALKHGTGRVWVEATVSDGSLVVTVHDEGGGIPGELGERAFDRFARADESRSTPGSGLGLALVRAVARAHGGEATLSEGHVTLRVPL